MTFPQQIAQRLNAALERLGLPDEAAVAPATDPRFGHYQSNSAMVLAKRLGENPRLLAQRLIDAIRINDLCEKPEIAGPGFLNFRLKPVVLARRIGELLGDPEHLGVERAPDPHRIVVDFSAPNIAKPMHVGHLRSTFIGDSLARIARFVGHHVITDNHLGDWGTQFGMIIHGWKTILDRDALARDPIAELVRVYREVNARTKEDPAVLEQCRAELVKLQAGDQENLAIWRECVDLSLQGLRRIYDWLGIHFDHYLGESAYNDRLAPLVDDLIASGVGQVSDGAICVFFPKNPELKDKPCLVRKADGGFLYATTDLATIDYREEVWGAEEVWYVVGAPQSLHFQQVFEVARRRGRKAKLIHVPHGSILGQDRKLMRTRSGDNVGLVDLLHEAVERARAVIEEKNPSLTDEEKEETARIVGLGAIKYAELSQHRMTDYIFSWDKMLALQGNTAPYLQYSYVRVRSIFRRLGDEAAPLPADPSTVAELPLETPEETALALKLAQFGEVVPEVLDDHRPNILANYLLELARAFHSFFEACPVLRSEGGIRDMRLVLCELTSRVLATGLGLLGIETPEKM